MAGTAASTAMLSAAASANAGTITTLTMVLIAIGALCAIAVIVWGTMRRRAKASEIAEAEKHAALAGHAPVEESIVDGAVAEEALEHPVESVPHSSLVTPAQAGVHQPHPQALDSRLRGNDDADLRLVAPIEAATHPLTTLKGLGPKAAARLAELGVSSVDQLATLSPDQIAAIDADMGSFAGRITRDRWVEQARLLAAGDIAGFEKAFGKLGG